MNAWEIRATLEGLRLKAMRVMRDAAAYGYIDIENATAAAMDSLTEAVTVADDFARHEPAPSIDPERQPMV